MKTRSYSRALKWNAVTVALAAVIVLDQMSHAQQAQRSPVTVQSNGTWTNSLAPNAAPQNDALAQILQDLDRLKVVLREHPDKGDEQRMKAIGHAKTRITQYFDLDMERRKTELEGLQKRADAMTEAMEKRRAAKAELVDLQLKAFRYEADGLGLFSERRGNLQESVLGSPIPLARPANMAGTLFMASTIFQPETTYPTTADLDPLKTALNGVNEARQNVQRAKSEEDRTNAATDLRKALGEYFDQDMKARQQEIDTINEGLQEMESSLQKRVAAKDDIVDLHLQVLINESNGLGFFSETIRIQNTRFDVTPNRVLERARELSASRSRSDSFSFSQ